MTKKENSSSKLGSIYHKFAKRNINYFTSSSRALPNFIIIGAVRCGTTSLYQNICEHPNVISAKQDEIGFFDSNFHLGLEWYKSFFPKNDEIEKLKEETGFGITGEDTPFYFWNKLSCDRILKTIPNCKLIVILRNPVNRAYSNYQLSVRNGKEDLSFEEVIGIEKKQLSNDGIYLDDEINLEKFKHPRSNLIKGWYYEQLKIWIEKFSDEQILIISTEDLENNPQETMNTVFDFLELPKYKMKKFQKLKFVKYKNMDDNIKQELFEYFKPKNEKLFSLINKKFKWDDDIEN